MPFTRRPQEGFWVFGGNGDGTTVLVIVGYWLQAIFSLVYFLGPKVKIIIIIKIN